MNDPDVYSYYLTVEGSDEVQERVYNLLSQEGPDVLGTQGYLELDGFYDDHPYKTYSTPSSIGAGDMWNEESMELLLHSIAVKVPQAVLLIEGQNEDNKTIGFTKRFHGDFFQETRLVTSMPPLIEGGDIRFDKRHEDPEKPFERKVHVLCEEHEDSDAIRVFNILAMSEDKDSLRQLMQAKISMDEYGCIADNGIDEDDLDHFKTNFENGFVEYYIFDQPILSREQALDLLKTQEYDTTFVCPGNLREIFAYTLTNFCSSNNYGRVDQEKIIDAAFSDPVFRSKVKQSYWGSYEHIPENLITAAYNSCYHHLKEKASEFPDYFEYLGAVSSLSHEDIIKDILVDSIYDISRSYHLPVTDLDEQLSILTRNADFRNDMNNICKGTGELTVGSAEYKAVVKACYDYVDSQIRQDRLYYQGVMFPKLSLDSMIHQAEERAAATATVDKAPGKEQGR